MISFTYVTEKKTDLKGESEIVVRLTEELGSGENMEKHWAIKEEYILVQLQYYSGRKL